MTDPRGNRPLLPSAENVRDRVIKRLEAWQPADAPAPAFLLHGRAGAGKTTVLLELREQLDRRYHPLLVSPPDLDLDAPLHFAVQMASGLRAHGANGALDVVVDRNASGLAKETALLEELKKLDRPLLLIDAPRSWATRPNDSGEQVALHDRVATMLSSLLSQAEQRKIPFVLAMRGHLSLPEGVARPERIEVHPGSAGTDFLCDRTHWGALADIASRLAALLGPRAEERSPIELRVAVALLALQYSDSDVRTASFKGLKALLKLFAEEVEHRATLRTALRVLSLARFPLDAALVDALLAEQGANHSGSEREWLVVKDALLMEQEGGLVLHSSIRSMHDREPVDQAVDEVRVHAFIAEALARSTADAPLLASRDQAMRKLERLYHAGRGLQRDVVLHEAIDDAQICTLARAFSLAGKKRDALELYETVLARAPQHGYARAYVAYHLDKLGREPLRAEALFKASYDAEPTNPWWARRYVCCLIGRGRLSAARDTWREAAGRWSDDDDDDDRAEWLARNFHLGIARQFLSRGALEPAREVLTEVPEQVRRSNGEATELWNQLLHMEESDSLGGAVFPLHIPFSERWNGPHLGGPTVSDGPIDAWYPGKIVGLGAQVSLRLAEPPAPGGQPQVLCAEMSPEDFLECARRSSLDAVSMGQFLEVVVSGAATRIELHPVRRRGLPVVVGFLQHMEEPE